MIFNINLIKTKLHEKNDSFGLVCVGGVAGGTIMGAVIKRPSLIKIMSGI